MARIARKALSATVVCLALSLGAGVLAGCAVNEKDIERWERTKLGPDKLVAIVTHNKYNWNLRTSAALALIRMKPRNGSRIGLRIFLNNAMVSLNPADRKTLVENLVGTLEERMAQKPTLQQGAGATPQVNDESVPYKDAAFGLLTFEKEELVTDKALRDRLKKALIAWAIADFDNRLRIKSQEFGLEQIFRAFREDGVRGLPPLVNADSDYTKMATLIAELGDQKTKEAGAAKLVDVAKYIGGDAWFKKIRPVIDETNKKSGRKDVKDKVLDAQVRDYQTEKLIGVFASFKKLGQRPTIDYLLDVAKQDGDSAKTPEKIRQAALAALEGNLDRKNAADIEKVLAIASHKDTPDAIRQLAFERIGELPREQVADKLYNLFTNERWKIRWVAASTLLKMSKEKDLEEFFSKLPKANADGFAMSEPLIYGDLIGKMKPPPSKERMAKELSQKLFAAKLTAIGYFYAHGTKDDLKLLAPLESEKTPLPKVTDDDAKWRCYLKTTDKEPKEVTNVGDFVKLCVEPRVTKNEPEKPAKKDSPKKLSEPVSGQCSVLPPCPDSRHEL
jgi:hypothetical protein